MQASFKQLRHETGSVLRAVERGETVTVTYRGRPVAEMHAIPQQPLEKDDELFGIWRDHGGVDSVEDFVDKLREGRYR